MRSLVARFLKKLGSGTNLNQRSLAGRTGGSMQLRGRCSSKPVSPGAPAGAADECSSFCGEDADALATGGCGVLIGAVIAG